MLSDKLEPLIVGVRQNREKWMEIAADNSLVTSTTAPVAGDAKDSNDNLSKPTTPDSKNGNVSPTENCRSCTPISD